MSVLVVEDNQMTRQNLIKILLRRDDKLNFLEAESAEQALEILEGNKVSVIILDNGLPGMQGVELLEKIHETNPFMKVIMTSAFLTAEDAARAAIFGAVKVLPKPTDFDLLYSLITE